MAPEFLAHVGQVFPGAAPLLTDVGDGCGEGVLGVGQYLSHFGLERPGDAAQLGDGPAEGPGRVGQLAGPEHDQGQDEEKDDLLRPEIEHGASLSKRAVFEVSAKCRGLVLDEDIRRPELTERAQGFAEGHQLGVEPPSPGEEGQDRGSDDAQGDQPEGGDHY
jgi:hypothetical protein